VYLFCFIHIHISTFPDFAECLNTDGQFFHIAKIRGRPLLFTNFQDAFWETTFSNDEGFVFPVNELVESGLKFFFDKKNFNLLSTNSFPQHYTNHILTASRSTRFLPKKYANTAPATGCRHRSRHSRSGCDPMTGRCRNWVGASAALRWR
jgi:hypothetical protein